MHIFWTKRLMLKSTWNHCISICVQFLLVGHVLCFLSHDHLNEVNQLSAVKLVVLCGHTLWACCQCLLV
jgi:hypothetical protein